MARKRTKNRKKQGKLPTQSTSRVASSGGHSKEIVGILTLGFAIFATASLLSLQLSDGALMGPFGRSVALGGYGLVGLCAYLFTAAIATVAVRVLLDHRPLARGNEILSGLLGTLSLTTLCHLIGAGYQVADVGPGGLVGSYLAEVLRAVISTAGTALVALIGFACAAVMVTPFRMRQVLTAAFRAGQAGGRGVADAAGTSARTVRSGFGHATGFCGEVIRAILPEREADAYGGDDDEWSDWEDGDAAVAKDSALVDPPIVDTATGRVAAVADDGDTERMEAGQVAAVIAGELEDAAANDGAAKPRKKAAAKKKATSRKKSAAKKSATSQADATGAHEAGEEAAKPAAAKKSRKKPAAVIVDAEPDPAAVAEVPADTTDAVAATPADEGDETDAEFEAAAVAEAAEVEIADTRPPLQDVVAGLAADTDAANDSGPEIYESQFRKQNDSEMRSKEKALDAQRKGFIKLTDGEYQLPPTNLLDYDASTASKVDRAAMLETSARLAKALSEYRIKGEIKAIRPGPVVTTYEFAPAPGTRVASITKLSDDLAMALGALRVRIVAPIPGKSVVGFEVPNDRRETVYLKEIIADDVMQKAKSNVTMGIGKDIEGRPSAVDLAKMPHLLVAGTTGSGKSVSVNSMIVSMLYNSTPEDLRMIMVDPKMLELSIYEGIPHLLLPVVTDPKKANLALRWAVDEMERRYELLAGAGVRDLKSYNKKAEKLRAEWEVKALERAAEEARRRAEQDEDIEITEEREQLDLNLEEPPKRLPKIVVVIDEFADLMMCAPKEVETSVARIAQKARAAGIHLILATQRPSVDVITGLIKANFPSRIAFRVSSKVDSRTILDTGGAEALLGAGDMLFSDRGSAPKRLHGCYIGEDEIHGVVEFLKSQAKPVYNLDIIKPREDEEDGEDGAGGGDDSVDEMYDRAVQLVAEARQVSISMIQRRLRIGYNRSARIVEHMEAQGVVTPPDHKNKREVLIEAA